MDGEYSFQDFRWYALMANFEMMSSYRHVLNRAGMILYVVPKTNILSTYSCTFYFNEQAELNEQ